MVRIVDGVIKIGSYDELNFIANKVNSNSKIGNSLSYYKNATYHLDANVDCVGKSLTPIGTAENPFEGIFLGNGYYIANFKIETDINNVGLFGYVNNCGLYGIKLSGSNVVSGKENVGMVVGYAKNGTILFNCSTYGAISGLSYVGGICGYFETDGIIENCNNFAKISSNQENTKLGGIVGAGSGVVVSCTNEEEIKFNADNAEVGGIISNSSNLISKCRNNGKIDCQGNNGYVGGIVAKTTNVVESSFNTANINSIGTITLGGIVSINRGTVESSYNIGKLSSIETLGGIVADNYGTINMCYNNGIIISNASYCGGVVGRNLTTVSKLQNCYNSGTVSSIQVSASPIDFGACFGGISGYNEGEITLCYNRSSVSAKISVDGIVGFSTNSAVLTDNYLLDSVDVLIDGVSTQGYSNYITNGVTVKTESQLTGEGALLNTTGFNGDIWAEKTNDANNYFLQLKCFSNAYEFNASNVNKVIFDSLQSVK